MELILFLFIFSVTFPVEEKKRRENYHETAANIITLCTFLFQVKWQGSLLLLSSVMIVGETWELPLIAFQATMKLYVYINDDESSQELYCDNRISNRKYTLLNFLPKNLWEQFRYILQSFVFYTTLV